MLKVVHAGDFHFDTPFSSLPSRLIAIRQEELRQSFAKIIDLTIRENANVLLLAGDLFDSSCVLPETIAFLTEQIGRIMSVKVFICAGNHDPYTKDSFYRTINFPPNVHIFGGEMEKVFLPEFDACIYGISFTERFADCGMLSSFVNDFEGISVMLMHGDISPNSRYNPISSSEIANSNLTYLALGHVHNHSGVLKAGNTYYAYPGAPEGRGFDEEGEKGVIVASLSPASCQFSFVPISKREYISVDIDISDCRSAGEIKDAILHAASNKNALYKIILSGTCSFLNVSVIDAMLQDELFFCKIYDKTMPEGDSISPESLKGRFFAALKNSDNPLSSLALKYGLSALDGRSIADEN